MELTIEVEDGAGGDLYQWLIEDPEVRRFAADAEPAEGAGRSGEMGLGFDILNLVVPNAIALASLVVSIAGFREQRQQSTGAAPGVNVRGGNVVVVVSGDGAEALRVLTQAADPAQAGVLTPAGTPAPAGDQTQAATQIQPTTQTQAATRTQPAAQPGAGAPEGGTAAP